MAVFLNDRVQARIYCTYRDQLAVNTLYYTVTTAPTNILANAATLAKMISGIISPVIRTILTTGATFYGVGCRTSTTGGPLTWSNPGYSNELAGVGAAGTDPMPTQCCFLIAWYTNFPGKKGRGRTYIPFPDNSDIVPGTGLITAGMKTTVQDLANLLGGASPVTFNYGLDASYYFTAKLQVHNYNTLNFYDVDRAAIVRTGVATQRRRGTTFGRLNAPPF